MNQNEIKEVKQPIDILIEKYPLVFETMSKETYNDLPSGWYGLLDKVCSTVEQYLTEEKQKNSDTVFEVLQIKEKFGGLRFYYTVQTNNEILFKNIQTVIDKAEDDSYGICQITGRPGALCKKGWYFMTLCEESRISHDFELVENGHKKSN